MYLSGEAQYSGIQVSISPEGQMVRRNVKRNCSEEFHISTSMISIANTS